MAIYCFLWIITSYYINILLLKLFQVGSWAGLNISHLPAPVFSTSPCSITRSSILIFCLCQPWNQSVLQGLLVLFNAEQDILREIQALTAHCYWGIIDSNPVGKRAGKCMHLY